jgi:hypothetical protein
LQDKVLQVVFIGNRAEMKNHATLTIVAAVSILLLPASDAMGRSFTLSDADLMSLDWSGHRTTDDPNLPKVLGKRDVAGPGVEFDIYFPKNVKDNPSTRSIVYVSSNRGGEGTLAGVDVNDYKIFALKFTLVAVDGNSSPDTGGLLNVGALINDGHAPKVLSFMQDHKTSAISSTSTDADKISIIGISVYKLSPIGWNPLGNTVTIKVEADPNSEILP